MNDDLERRLRDALHARADRTPIAGDGLSKIRSRTAGRRRHARWQPTLAAGALTALVVAGVAAAVERDHGTHPDVVLPAGGVTASPSPTPTPSSTSTPSADPTFTPSTCRQVMAEGQNILCGPGTFTSIPKDTGGEYIAITSPASGGVVHHTFTVSGRARVFEAQFTVDISQNGVVIKTAHVTASAGAPELGTWSTTFTLPDGNYRIDAYELSAKGDGSKAATDTVWIQVGSPPGPPEASRPSATGTAR
jgi:hypothetical protein